MARPGPWPHLPTLLGSLVCEPSCHEWVCNEDEIDCVHPCAEGSRWRWTSLGSECAGGACAAARQDSAAEEPLPDPSMPVLPVLPLQAAGLNQAVFQDARWDSALQHLQTELRERDRRAYARQVLRQGALAFGLWHLSDLALEALECQLTGGQEAAHSAILEALLAQSSGFTTKDQEERVRTEARRRESNFRRAPAWTFPVTKLAMVLAVLATALLIVAPAGSSPTVDTFGWPLVVAQATGVGALLWTGLLLLSTLRVIHYWSSWRWLIDRHACVNAFAREMMFVFGVIHAVAHACSTYEAFAHRPPEELNLVLKCADADRSTVLSLKHLPPCPIQRNYSFLGCVFTIPGLTGVVLFVTLRIMAHSHRYAGKYDLCSIIDKLGIWAWLMFLFFHGSQDWFGIGLPLVVPVCAVPVGLHFLDRGLWALHRCLVGDRLRIASMVIRPGKDGGPHNCMILLQMSKSALLWRLKEGMYAYFCIPEISRWQRRPFTICSYKDEDTVDFFVQGVDGWTEALALRCLDIRKGQRARPPAVSLDGPYVAPMAAALGSEVLIAIGAGVGIMAFLSLMASTIAALSKSRRRLPLLEVHFFWMARSADEFLFGRRHFTRVAASPDLDCRVHFHLHLTAPQPEHSEAAFLFREAVRRQSRADRAAFFAAGSTVPRRTMLPSGWVEGTAADVVWVSGLVESASESEEEKTAEAYRDHWTAALNASAAPRGVPVDSPSIVHTSPAQRNSGIFRRTVLHATPLDHSRVSLSGFDALMPLTFGRPDFITEIQSIGKTWGSHNIHVCACGNRTLIEALREVCKVCNENERIKNPEKANRYIFRHERFVEQ